MADDYNRRQNPSPKHGMADAWYRAIPVNERQVTAQAAAAGAEIRCS